MRTLRAEWTKLHTTASLWWTTSLFLFFSFLFPLIQITMTDKNAPGAALGFTPSNMLLGMTAVAIVVIIIQAVMVVTTEYRYGVHTVTYTATPKRWKVLAAKLFLYATYAAVLSFLATVVVFAVGRLMLGSEYGAALEFGLDAVQEQLWKVPLTAVMMVVLAMGVGMLVRQSAGAISIVLVWYLMLEGLLSMLPKIGKFFTRFGPITNFNAFINDSPIPDAPWETTGSLVYSVVVFFVILLLGMLLINKRDV